MGSMVSTQRFSMFARKGEVVGLTGLIGSGYDDIVNLCFGAIQAADT